MYRCACSTTGTTTRAPTARAARAARITASRARARRRSRPCARGCSLGHENFLTRLGDHLGLHDVELEYDDFNRRFRVKCDDQKFAFSLLDGKMMQWLLGADTFDSVEVDGPWVLLAGPKLDPARWLDLGDLARRSSTARSRRSCTRPIHPVDRVRSPSVMRA